MTKPSTPTIKQQIINLLSHEDSRLLTAQQISRETKISLPTVRATLSKGMKDRTFRRVITNCYKLRTKEDDPKPITKKA